ncbi:MAG: exosortase A [Steroidobacteraceae bacterium]
MPRIPRNFLLVCLMLGATVAALWPSAASLSASWEDTGSLTYTHGYAIVAVVAWLLWRSRRRVEAEPLRPCWPAVAALGGSGVLWYLAWSSGIQIVHESLLPPTMLAAVLAVAGWRVAALCAFPVGYLYFAVPVWGVLNDGLQSLTTTSVSVLLRFTGVRAYVEGNFVHIPAGTFEIAGGCSGLHFLIVALAIAALQGELERVGLRTRVLLLVLAGSMAVVTNWVRVYGIILNGYFTDMRGYLVAVDHYRYGWILFALMMCLYFWASRRVLSKEPVAVPVDGPGPVADRVPLPALAAAFVALAVAPGLSQLSEHHVVRGAARVLLPPGQRGWSGPLPAETDWAPLYPGADASALAAYSTGTGAVLVYVNVYRYQSQGHELVGYDNDLLRGLAAGVSPRDAEPVRVSGGAFTYTLLRVRAAGGDLNTVGYLLVVDGRPVDGELRSKLYYAVSALARPTPSGIVAVAARCAADCADAERVVAEYLQLHVGALAGAIARSAEAP